MGNLGITLGEQTAKYIQALGKKSVLQTKPIQHLNVKGLKLKPLAEDVVELKKVEKIIDKSNLSETIRSAKTHFYSSEEQGLKEVLLGKTEREANEIMSSVKEYKTYGRHWDWCDGSFEEEVVGVDRFINFAITNEKFDNELANKIIQLLKEKPYLSNTVESISRFNNSPSEVKSKLVDLIKTMDANLEHIPLQGVYGDTQLAKTIRSFVKIDSLPEKQLERINILDKLANDGVDLENLEKVLYDAEGNIQNIGLVENFLKLSFPSKEISEIFQEKPNEVINLLSKYKSKIGTDKIILDKLGFDLLSQKDPEILRLIEEQSQKINNLGSYEFRLGEAPLFSDKIGIQFASEEENKIVNLFYDNAKRMLQHKEVTSRVGDKYLVKSRDFANHTDIEQLLSESGKIVSETKTVRNAQGKVLYTDKLVESAIEGQNNLYRIMPDGKKLVLSEAFKDPETGETIIKKSLESINKTKTEYLYKRLPNGNYTSHHRIVDKNGKELMNIERSYEKIDDNHFVTTVNGRKYNVELKGDELFVESNDRSARIDLRKLIPSGDKNLKDLVINLPGDELYKMGNFSSVRQIKRDSFEPNNAKCLREYGKTYIKMGDNIVNKRSVLLHEYGHSYSDYFDGIKDFVNETYQKELKTYRQNTSLTELRTMDYLVDNKYHYLNERGDSALEECIADVNALLTNPNDWTNIADRVLRFQTNFPETFAKIAECLVV